MSIQQDKIIEAFKNLSSTITDQIEEDDNIVFAFYIYIRDRSDKDKENPDWKIKYYITNKWLFYYDAMSMQMFLTKHMNDE